MRVLPLLAVIIGSVAAVLLLRAPTTTKQAPSPTPTVSTAPTPPAQSTDVAHNGKLYRIAWMIVADPSRLTLIPNFTQKRTARSFIDANECAAVVNAGFYTKDNQPTGLFIAQGETIRKDIPNPFLNGYVVVDKNDAASIRVSAPEYPVRIALQTGPILIRDGKILSLLIRDDEFARRVVAAMTRKAELVFLSIYDPNDPWSGPKLADTLSLLSTIVNQLALTDAINLDGGSASAFMRNDVSLEELTSVGSFFCIR